MNLITYVPMLSSGAIALSIAAAQAAQDASRPLWLVLAAPAVPVILGFLFTAIKLKKQDKKVQEIHVLVNSRLSKTLDALSAALVENIRLKDQAGLPVTPAERREAENPVPTSPADPPLMDFGKPVDSPK